MKSKPLIKPAKLGNSINVFICITRHVQHVHWCCIKKGNKLGLVVLQVTKFVKQVLLLLYENFLFSPQNMQQHHSFIYKNVLSMIAIGKWITNLCLKITLNYTVFMLLIFSNTFASEYSIPKTFNISKDIYIQQWCNFI